MTTGTFGKTAIAAYSFLTSTYGAAPVIVGCRFLSPANVGAITKLTAYIYAVTGTVNAYAFIYADDAGQPGAKLATSSLVSGITDAGSWVDFAIDYTPSPSKYYWLAVECTGAYVAYVQAGTVNQLAGAPYITGDFPSPDRRYNDYVMSIYATYTVSTFPTSWAITSSLLSVTLPLRPRSVDDAHPVQIEEVTVEGGQSVLISRFTKARKLTLQGSLYVSGYSNYTLYISYLEPLIAMKRQIVTITDPDLQFTGDWLMGEPVFHREAEGTLARYTYTMTFLQGESIVMVL